MQLNEIDNSNVSTTNDIFYNFPAYDGLDFEIQSIYKSLIFCQDLFKIDNLNNPHGEKEIIEKKKDSPNNALE